MKRSVRTDVPWLWKTMDKIICYQVKDEDEQEFGGKAGLILKHRLHLTPHEISRLKFAGDGITAVLPGKEPVSRYRIFTESCLLPGEILRICIPDDPWGSDKVLPVSHPLSVLYEDEDLLIVDKTAGTAVHPSHGHYSDTMANYTAAFFQERGETSVCRVIGRLDKDTSGVLVYAKNRMTASRLASAARTETARPDRDSRFRREYYALAYGSFAVKSGSVHEPIAPCEGELMKQEINHNRKRADTYYEVLGEKTASTGVISLVWLHIGTGRTHQIRVHMAYLGHPLLGDSLYGNGEDDFGRTMLHAYRATIVQPFTGETVRAVSPFPEDFRKAGQGLLSVIDRNNQ